MLEVYKVRGYAVLVVNACNNSYASNNYLDWTQYLLNSSSALCDQLKNLIRAWKLDENANKNPPVCSELIRAKTNHPNVKPIFLRF